MSFQQQGSESFLARKSGEPLFLSKDFPCSQRRNSQKYRDQLDCYASPILSDMDTEITVLEARRDKTRDLKQGMMQELLTGKIRLI